MDSPHTRGTCLLPVSGLHRALLGSGSWSRLKCGVHMQNMALTLFMCLSTVLGIEARAACIHGNRATAETHLQLEPLGSEHAEPGKCIPGVRKMIHLCLDWMVELDGFPSSTLAVSVC